MQHNNNLAEGSTPPKFSRYRSVRAKAVSEPIQPPPVPVPVEHPAEVKRGPSRYRRNRSGTNVESPPPLPSSAPRSSLIRDNGRVAATKIRSHEDSAPRPEAASKEQDTRARDRAHTTGSHAQTQASRYHRREDRTDTTTSDSSRPPTANSTYEAAREEARMILEGEFDRLQKLKKLQDQQQSSNGSGAPDMRRRPTTAKDKEKEKVRVDAVKHSPPKEVKERRKSNCIDEEEPAQTSPVRRNVRQLIIGGGGNAPLQLHKQKVEKHGHSRKASKVAESERQVQVAPISSAVPPINPAAPVPEAVRAFDAPISAVNAGDRRVEVKCNSATITLPVTPSTTVKDLLNSASLVMSEHIDPKTAVLIEAFSYLGLERPLRRYERIRDVMNSWATDSQHHLVIMAEAECSATGLELKDAPISQPQSTKIQMHHSSSPGKWDKRYITLRDDGQVTISKHETGKEGTNICHLSDFDLYNPTSKQKKILRTPKKACFAVKSQQKAAMFLEGQNFAHFFCSNQCEDVDGLYKALHGWRSWYLVHVLGEGGQKLMPEPRMYSVDIERRPGSARSRDTVPYQLGSFKPLLDFGELKLGTGSDERVGEGNNVRSLTRTAAPPPSSFPKRLVLDAVEPDERNGEEQPFTGTGLLARSASRRTQGGHGSGRGVGGVKGRPLVNLSASSEFADGSLLRKLEVWNVQHGEGEPKIDREKRFETNVKVGEGS